MIDDRDLILVLKGLVTIIERLEAGCNTNQEVNDLLCVMKRRVSNMGE